MRCTKMPDKEWNTLLGVLEVEGKDELDKKKFYTNLYRVYVGRTIYSDVNGKYVDMYEKEQQMANPEVPMYGGDAFWNTFWNLNQVWTLATPIWPINGRPRCSNFMTKAAGFAKARKAWNTRALWSLRMKLN